MSLEHGDNGFVGRFWANREAPVENKQAGTLKEAKMSCAGGDALREEAGRERAEKGTAELQRQVLLETALEQHAVSGHPITKALATASTNSALTDATTRAQECVETARRDAEAVRRAHARLIALEGERRELENLLRTSDESASAAAQRLETIRRYGCEVLGGGPDFISDCARAALDLGQYRTGIERIRTERAREREQASLEQYCRTAQATITRGENGLSIVKKDPPGEEPLP